MDLDPFDDILTDHAAKNARAGDKFQPKAKTRQPKRGSAAPLVPSTQKVQPIDTSASEFTESLETHPPSEPGGQRVSAVADVSQEHAQSTERLDSMIDFSASENVFLHDSNEDWQSCFGKNDGENADIFIGLDSLDFLHDSTTVLENAIPSSDASAAPVSGNGNAEEELSHSPVSDSSCLSDLPGTSARPEVSETPDPLTAGEPIVSVSGGGSLTANGNLETELEGIEAYAFLETLDIPGLGTASGQKIGKFHPKSKMQTQSGGGQVSIISTDVLGPGQGQQLKDLLAHEIDLVDQGSISAFTPNDLVEFPTTGLSHITRSELTSEIPADEEHQNLVEPSHLDAGIPAENLESGPEIPAKLASRRAKTRKSVIHTASDDTQKQEMASKSNQADVSGRSLRKRRNRTNIHQLIDEPEDEGLPDGDQQAESPSNSAVNKDDSSVEEFQLVDESRETKVRKKSKKSPGVKEKPARKRKDSDVAGQVTEAAPKKFSHTTRRRRVDKTLLETPEHEIDYQKVPLRDLILLAEYKERTAKKEATTSQAPLPSQSGNNAPCYMQDGFGGFQHYDDDGFASVQDEEPNDESNPVHENSGYFNYQTYMDKTPIARWSKQDTELFYEAIQQFGTDLSMIQQLFPGRTRRQIKLKYKKEERQHPLRLREALTNRAKDHSHFEHLIERLKQMAAEETQNSNTADSVSLAGEKEDEEGTPETNDEAKSDQINDDVFENAEQNFPGVRSPIKSCDSDDDLLRWSQYKSEDYL